MSTAYITLLRSGGAVYEFDGLTRWFPDWRSAVAEASSQDVAWAMTASPDAVKPVEVTGGAATCP